MNSKAIFPLILLITSLFAVTADLTLVQYDPLVFQLNFSEPVQNTSFQLLFNNIYNIPYVFESNISFGSLYRMQADTSNIQKTTSLQTYNLLFTNPINVANGNLNLECYLLSAKKKDIVLKFPAGLGIVLVFAAYAFNTFTEIGKLAIEFIHIYILCMFQSRMTTTILPEMYTGMLMIPPSKILLEDWSNYQSYIMLCLIAPFAIIVFLGALGFIYKRFAVGQKSILGSLIYEELVFNAFIKSYRVFMFNLIYNSFMFVKITKNSAITLPPSYQNVGFCLVYFNILTCVSLIYLKIYILNPNLTKKQENIEKYLTSKQFMGFNILHERVLLSPWYKRNYSIFQSLKILFLAGIFFCDSLFQYVALLLEFMHIFYLFAVRPLCQRFYLNTKVVCRLFLFTTYLLIVIGNLYFSLGEVTFNYASASRYIVARDTVYLIVHFILIIVIIFQIYFKCSSLNYQIMIVKEANAYKILLVKKNKIDTDSKKIKLIAISDKFPKEEKTRVHSFSEINSPSKGIRDSYLPHLKGSSPEAGFRGRIKSKIQIEMKDMAELGHEVEKQLRREKAGSLPKEENEKLLNKQNKRRQKQLS